MFFLCQDSRDLVDGLCDHVAVFIGHLRRQVEMDDAAEIIERVRAHIGSVLHGLRLVIGADPRALDVGGSLFLDDVQCA